MNLLHEILPSLVRLGLNIVLSNPIRVPAYLGPDTVVPLASIIATVIGFLLVFWRLILKTIKRLIRMIRRQPEEPSLEPELDEIPVADATSGDPVSKDG